jgi:long-chain acyl-CoA synthetase
MDESIYSVWKRNNLNTPERAAIPAIDYFGNTKTFTEADELIDIYARAFLKLGIEPSRQDYFVTICALALPSTTYALYALNKLGIGVNFVTPGQLGKHPQYYLTRTNSDTLLLLDAFFPMVAPSLIETDIKNIIVLSTMDDIGDIPDWIPAEPRQLFNPGIRNSVMQNGITDRRMISLPDFIQLGVDNDKYVAEHYIVNSTAIIVYTGGSTGLPKGVELTNESINSIAKIQSEFGYLPGDRNFRFAPDVHATVAVHTTIIPWSIGATHVFQPAINYYASYTDAIRNLNIQFSVSAPSHLTPLISATLKPNELSALKRAYIAGEPTTKIVIDGIEAAFRRGGKPQPYVDFAYGMSELGPLAIFSAERKDLGQKVGLPVAGAQARIVDENGKELGDNQKGWLEIKTIHRMKSYYKNPKATGKFFSADGYGKTGDIAFRDENGNYMICGRVENTVYDADGNMINTQDIHELTAANDDVLDTEVIKQSIQENGNTKFVPFVHIVLMPSAEQKAVECLRNMVAVCNVEYSGNAIPRAYKFRSFFPQNPDSDKRDYQLMLSERDNYYRLSPSGELERVSFLLDGEPVIEPADEIMIE